MELFKNFFFILLLKKKIEITVQCDTKHASEKKIEPKKCKKQTVCVNLIIFFKLPS